MTNPVRVYLYACSDSDCHAIWWRYDRDPDHSVICRACGHIAMELVPGQEPGAPKGQFSFYRFEDES